MARLFVALAPPAPLAEQLAWMRGGVPGARWEPAEKLHLTLAFLGETTPDVQAACSRALRGVRVPGFALRILGAGVFPPRGSPHALWIGIAPSPALEELQRRVAAAVTRAGATLDPRRFHPHVTLARLQGAPVAAVGDFVASHALPPAGLPGWRVTDFRLLSSVRNPGGSSYRVEEVFGLAEPTSPAPLRGTA